MKIIGHSFLSTLMVMPLLAGCDSMADGQEGTNQSSAAVEGRESSRSAVLKSANGVVVSTVQFNPIGDGLVRVTGRVDFPGIRAGFHGIHIHANDNPANGAGCIADPAQPANTHFVSADGHWNPTAQTHGQHAGDMPNVLVRTDGHARLDFTMHVGPLSNITGRAMILHDQIDNHGNIPVGAVANQYTPNAADATALTQATGNAGNRIGCGLIQ